MYLSSTTTEILISEVEIICKLMFSFDSGLEHLACYTDVRAHADADDGDFGYFVVAADFTCADAVAVVLTMSMALAKSLR